MIACYDLSRYLASFEFFNWLVMAQADGASKIIFDLSRPKLKNFTFKDVLMRFKTILEPGPELAGLPCSIGSTVNGNERFKTLSCQSLIPWVRSGRTFRRLETVKPAVAGNNFTVTIRSNKAGARSRDSSSVWREFAKRIAATVIEDWYDKPIHLHDRMALYAGAKMNFGVCNGPTHMLSLTSYPVAMFVNSQSAYNSQVRWGMKAGEKYPWMLSNQNLIWQDDTDLDAMLRTFDGMKL